MRLSSFFLLGLSLALLLPACDSNDSNDPVLTGFSGDADLLGMWQELDEETGEPDPQTEYFLEVVYDAQTRTTSASFWGREVEYEDCWYRGGPDTLSDVTRTTFVVDDESDVFTVRYAANASSLTFSVASSDEELENLYRRSTRSAASFRPLCAGRQRPAASPHGIR